MLYILLCGVILAEIILIFSRSIRINRYLRRSKLRWRDRIRVTRLIKGKSGSNKRHGPYNIILEKNEQFYFSIPTLLSARSILFYYRLGIACIMLYFFSIFAIVFTPLKILAASFTSFYLETVDNNYYASFSSYSS